MELTREYLDGEVAKLEALADSVKTKQGSAAARLRDATEQAMGVDVSFGADEDLAIFEFVYDTDGEGKRTFNLGALATFVHTLDEWAAQVANEAVSVILKSQGDDTSLDAMKAQYATQRTMVEALLTVLTTATDIDVSDVVLPTLRTPRSSAPGTAKKGKHGHFYRVVEGERRDQGDHQDQLSSIAWYYGAAITEQTGKGSTNKGKGVPVNELEAYLRKNVTDSPLGKPWTVEREGVTFGFEIIGGEEAKSEEE